MRLPKIKADLLIQELNEEVLIYDKTTHQSYCLNQTAKIVFNHCDGKKTFADVNLPEDIIYLSLDELSKRNLIQSNYDSPFAGLSRREVVRRVGLASLIALPLISSLIAPTAANAASSVQSDCPQRGGTCIRAGQNLCAGRANQRVTFNYYDNGGGTCQGTVSQARRTSCAETPWKLPGLMFVVSAKTECGCRSLSSLAGQYLSCA